MEKQAAPEMPVKGEGEQAMTEQKTREKIINILNATEISVELSKEDIHTFADALIAAGIGDVKEAELERKAYEVASNQYRIWFEEQKDRAERAERALMTVCTNVIKDEEDDLAIEPRARVLYKAYLKQAEKELTEERKDD